MEERHEKKEKDAFSFLCDFSASGCDLKSSLKQFEEKISAKYLKKKEFEKMVK